MTKLQWIIAPQEATPPKELFQLVSNQLDQLDLLESRYNYDGIDEEIEAIKKEIEGQRRYGFNLVGKRTRISMMSSGQYKVDMLSARVPSSTAFDFIDLIAKSCLACKGVLYCFAVDEDYSKWQNETDLSEYESVEGLKIVSNGLPSPLTEDIVDISENPGREIWRSGYREAVGGVMWLTDLFFETTGAKRSNLRDATFLENLESDFNMRLILDRHFFRNAESDGEMAKMQDELRAIIYPKNNTFESMT